MSNCFPRLKANTYCFNWMKSVHIFLSQHKNSFHTKLFFRSIGGSHFCIYLVSQVEGGGLPLQKKTFRGEWFGATLVGWLRRLESIIISITIIILINKPAFVYPPFPQVSLVPLLSQLCAEWNSKAAVSHIVSFSYKGSLSPTGVHTIFSAF